MVNLKQLKKKKDFDIIVEKVKGDVVYYRLIDTMMWFIEF